MRRQTVSSSTIASAGYDGPHRVLEVEFTSGSLYQYFGVPKNLYRRLMSAASRGAFFNRHIRGHFDYRRLQERRPGRTRPRKRN